jgi:protease-4
MVKRMLKWLGKLNPFRVVRYGIFALRNWRRRFYKLDYITWIVPQQMPALPESKSWLQRRILGAGPLSLVDVERMFRQIGDDPRPKGIILHLRGFAMPLADLQTLRGSMLRLRTKGKRVICFAQGYDNVTYYVASAADEIILQPGGEVATIGLRSSATFYRDALETIGVALDSVAISPYKGAYDSFTRNTISAEGQEQLEWLLDSRYEGLVNDIAAGRKTTPESVKTMIDSAPHLDEEAEAAGYVDEVLSEEDLERRLDSKLIVPWANAAKMLFRKWRKPFEQVVALLPINGMMLPGESTKPPVDIPIPFVGSERVGDLTVVQQVRALMANKSVAAVILHIDSGGGAAITAEAMTAALDELAQSRPIVVYMNNVAASGGYWVATPARWIVAQPGTITGSIGVLLGKPITGGLFEKLRVNRVEFARGANANLFSDVIPFTDDQRARMMLSIEHLYERFVQRVARSRHMSAEAVDAISGGRVWTGTQAKANGLVDELGDLQAALTKARALANLPDDAPLMLAQGKSKPLPAQLAEQSNPAAIFEYMRTNAKALVNGTAMTVMPFTLD